MNNFKWKINKNYELKGYSGLPNGSTALMRALVDKKSKNAKSTSLQNVHNESRFLLVDKKCKVYQYEFVRIKY